MPVLPSFDLTKRINYSPHVVILGAGASKAAFRRGDASGKQVPVMAELAHCLELEPSLAAVGFPDGSNFESIYDELASTNCSPALKLEIEYRVRSYFESLALPETPTLYDYLLVSLREDDLIATYNWDPFLALAFKRNRLVRNLPQLAFLHGNVEIAFCVKDQVKGFRGDICRKCDQMLEPTTLLYPVRKKDYKSDPFIANERSVLKDFLNEAYMLTIFGYGAPATDTDAVDLMSRVWTNNPRFELGQVSIVDIKSKEELERTWEPFFCRSHYGIHKELSTSWILRHPRRSREALVMATLQNAPWQDNPFPDLKTLSELHSWIAPLIAEEGADWFSGEPCPKS
jgi:hypothetical protein